MTKVLKMAAATVALTLGSALPVLAQIDNGMTFTTAFPFYAGNTKMPAGSYRIAQTDINTDEFCRRAILHRGAQTVAKFRVI